MRENGTDRDIALKISEFINSIKDLIATVNANLFSPYILTQPVDVENAQIGDNVYFSVSAANVTAYQWQSQASGSQNWNNTSVTGYNTNTLTVAVTEARIGAKYRCALTGKDGTVIYTSAAQIVPPENIGG